MPRPRSTVFDTILAPLQSGSIALKHIALSVVMPQATTNLVTNPSLETNTTGYTTSSATLTRVVTQQRRGVWSGKIVTSGANGRVIFGALSLTAGQTYTFSVDLKGTAGVSYQIRFGTAAGASISTAASQYVVRATGQWQRIAVPYKETATTSDRSVVVVSFGPTGDTFYVDGLQVETGLIATTYCDGDITGATKLDPPAYQWSGVPHASTSIRSWATMHGGQIVALSDLGIELLSMAGAGIPPATNIITPFAAIDGATYQQQLFHDRILTLVLALQGKGTTDVERKYDALSTLFNRDTAAGQPVRCFLQLLDRTGKPITDLLEFQAVYASGLERTISSPYGETLSLKLILPDPMFEAAYDVGTGPFGIGTVATGALVQSSGPGVYTSLTTVSGGATNTLSAIAYNPTDGKLYVSGDFTSPGTRIISIDLTNNNTINTLGGGANGDVNTIIIDEQGRVGVGGNFTSIGGVAANRLAYWDGAWHAMGTGTNGVVYTMAIGPRNHILVGGNFTTFNGVACTNLGAMSSFGVNMGAPIGSINGIVYAVVFGQEATYFGGSEQVPVYIGGAFTQVGASAINRIAKSYYRPATRTIDNPDVSASAPIINLTGADDYVRGLVFDNNGLLYILGKFIFLCNVSCGGVGMWDGGSINQVWSSLLLYDWPTTSVPNPAVSGCVDTDNTIWIAGAFANVINPDAYTWTHSGGLIKVVGNQVQLPEIKFTSMSAVTADPNGNVYMQTHVGDLVGNNLTVTNLGTANTYPILRIANAGNFEGGLVVTNVTTRKVFLLDDLFQSQRADHINGDIIIDFDPDHFRCMTVYGQDLRRFILPQSNTAEMYLVPGQNTISINRGASAGDVITPYLYWKPRYLSLDGAVP